MPSFQAEYVSTEILDLIKKDLAERGYQPSDTHITLTGGNLDNLKISMTISPIPSQPVEVKQPAKSGRIAVGEAGPEVAVRGKGKHGLFNRPIAELTPEEQEARRARQREYNAIKKERRQKEAEAKVKAQAEANELEDIRQKSEAEVVAPSNPPFQQPEVRKRIPAGTPVLPQTGIRYRGYPVEAAAAD